MSSDNAVDSENIQPPTKMPPITAYERSLLLQLIEERQGPIEDRKTTFATYTKKNAAWKEVEQFFNADGQTVKRTHAQLKKIWENRKQSSKKTVTRYKKAVRRTGGGPAPPSLPPEVERISAMIPEQLNSLSNPFDSDAAMEMNLDANHSVVIEETVQPENNRRENGMERGEGVSEMETADVDQENDVNECSPPAKKPKKSKDPRSMLVEYEREEHWLRMKNLRLQQEILNAELRLKNRTLEMMEEEHTKKMNAGF